ncbi:MAG: alpha/beta fold hydrolase [candidate division KSB1 bacterium]|nr:alpha/beta fold hydrolase [candidate division KSB1 bacterium]
MKPLNTKKKARFLIPIQFAVAFLALLEGLIAGENLQPIIIREQGSFMVGGKVIKASGTFDPYHPTSAGQTLHGDHAYVFYQIPVQAKKLPMVMWHGFGQFSKTWETTPDGRDGFQNIFLRRGYSVYVLDQPRRGNAGRSTVSAVIEPLPDEQQWFGTFRLGIWPNFFEGVQFPRDSTALEQFFRAMTPDTGPIDVNLNVEAVSALFDKIGAGILVTHSHSGGMGWLTAIKNQNVRAIVSFEPGSGFLFPEGKVPEPKPSSGGTLSANAVPMSDFLKLTQIPIVIYYGDFIPAEPSPNPGQDGWRVRLEMAKIWRDVVNDHGGNVTLVHLPEIGIRGNTHFPFSDLNNLEIADLVSKWLKEKGLDH